MPLGRSQAEFFDGLVAASRTGGSGGRFRTAPLRNVAVTAPYLHDGSAPTLHDAIARHEGFAALPEADSTALIAFLSSLTDPAFLENPRFALPQTACGKAL